MELAVLANLWTEAAVLIYHQREQAIYNRHMEGRYVKLVAFMVGMLHLESTSLS
jgi:hypothetical protein